MPLYQVVILAIVQGFTEFLPVSSTAHLYLTSWLLGWQPQTLEFDIALHVGTLLAVLIYFFKDLLQITAAGFGISWGDNPELRQNRAMLWLIAIGTVPVVIFGLLLNKYAETTWRNPFIIAAMMIGIGILMWLAERSGRKKRDLATLDLADVAVIGLSQSLAIVPGTSRSGITISTGLFRGLTRESAARFSFLLSTPAIAGAAVLAIHDLSKQGMGPGMLAPFIVGIIVSALTGCAVIAWFLRYVRHQTLYFFVYYRIVFGIIVLALAFFRRPAG